MNIELPDQHGTGTTVGAVVIRTDTGGNLYVDFGPADGAPTVRFSMSNAEAEAFQRAIATTLSAGEETTLILDDHK